MSPDEVADARANRLAPAPSAEDAVVADAGHQVMLAPLGGDAGAKSVRGLGLAVAGNVVELAFDREQRRLADRLRPHELVPHAEAAFREVMLLEHALSRVAAVLGGHVERVAVIDDESPESRA